MSEMRNAPTQVRRPWRTTARTVIAAAVALVPLLPEISRVAGIDTIPVVASVLTVIAALTRIFAIPEVDAWMDKYFPYLSADPMDTIESDNDEYIGKHRR